MARYDEIFECEVFDEGRRMHLDELCRICGVETTVIVEFVSEGILEVQGQRQEEWYFTGVSIKRVRTALRLQQDLDLNLPGVALVLDLLEELEELRRRTGRS